MYNLWGVAAIPSNHMNFPPSMPHFHWIRFQPVKILMVPIHEQQTERKRSWEILKDFWSRLDQQKPVRNTRPDKDMTDEQLADMAPWSEKLQSIKNRM